MNLTTDTENNSVSAESSSASASPAPKKRRKKGPKFKKPKPIYLDLDTQEKLEKFLDWKFAQAKLACEGYDGEVRKTYPEQVNQILEYWSAVQSAILWLKSAVAAPIGFKSAAEANAE